MFTASLVLIGTDDPDSHIGSVISPLWNSVPEKSKFKT